MNRCMLPKLLTLVCAVAAATAAQAQPPDQVLIEIQNAPPGGTAEIFVAGTTADHTFVGTSSGSIASNFMSDAKPVDVAIDRCGDQVSVTVVGDGDLFLPEQENCDRKIVENVPWGGGRRLVIDARRGTVVSVPAAAVSSPTAATAPTGTTIGTRPEVQSASQTALNALRAAPSTEANARVVELIAELPTTPDTALSTWITRFTGRFGNINKLTNDDNAIAASSHLLTLVQQLHDNRTPAAGAGTAPATMRESRGFNFTVSENYGRQPRQPGTQSTSTGASRYVNLGGRFLTPGGPLSTPNPNVTWFYNIGFGRSVGLSNGPNSDSVVFSDPSWDDWIEVTDTETTAIPFFTGREGRTPLRVNRAGFAEIVRLGSLVNRILPAFVRRGLRFSGPVSGAPSVASTTGTLAGARVGSGQGQVSLAAPPPSSNQNGSIPRPPQLLLAARSFVETLRQTFVPPPRFAAFSGPGVRLVIGPRGRREYWIEPMQSGVAPRQAASDVPRPSMKVFIRSLGRSTGDNAQQAIIINDGNVPVRVLEGDAFATEPLEGVSEQTLAKEMEKYAGRPRVTMNLTSYCLNFEKAAPTKGGVYRVAATTAQDQLEPVRRILQAAEQVRDGGELHPDGDPNLYFHSVRQWAIWTVEKNFNERTFAEALLEYTKKNVVAAGRQWNREIETAARSIIPNRWRDVQRVLAEARQ